MCPVAAANPGVGAEHFRWQCRVSTTLFKDAIPVDLNRPVVIEDGSNMDPTVQWQGFIGDHLAVTGPVTCGDKDYPTRVAIARQDDVVICGAITNINDARPILGAIHIDPGLNC